MKIFGKIKRLLAFILVVALTLTVIWTDDLIKAEKVKAEPIDDVRFGEKTDETVGTGVELPKDLFDAEGNVKSDVTGIISKANYTFDGVYYYDSEASKYERIYDKGGIKTGITEVYAGWVSNSVINLEADVSTIVATDGAKISIINDDVSITGLGTVKDGYVVDWLTKDNKTLSRDADLSTIKASVKLSTELIDFTQDNHWNNDEKKLYVTSADDTPEFGIEEPATGFKITTHEGKLVSGENKLVLIKDNYESDAIPFEVVIDTEGPAISDVQLGTQSISSGGTVTYGGENGNSALTVNFKVTDAAGIDSVTYTVNGGNESVAPVNSGSYSLSIPAYDKEDAQETVNYEIEINAKDKLENGSDVSFTVKVKRDTKKPEIIVKISDEEVDTSKTFSSNKQITLGITTSDGEDGNGIADNGFTYQIDTEAERIISGATGSIILPGVDDGEKEYTVLIKSKDKFGNQASKTVTVFIDKDIPVIAEYSSTGWLKADENNEVKIDLTATENQAANNNAFSVEGDVENAESVSAGETALVEAGGVKYQATYTIKNPVTSDTGNNKYTEFTAKFTDAVGNSVTKKIKKLMIDADKPVFDECKFDKNGSEIADIESDKVNGTVRATLRVSDVGSGIKEVTYKYGTESGEITPDGNNDYIVDIDTTKVTDGKNEIIFTVKDNAGNTNEKKVTIDTDNTSPEFTVELKPEKEGEYYSNGNYYSSLKFTFTQDNNEEDIDKYYYSEDENAAVASRKEIGNPYTLSASDLSEADGDKTFYFWAVDEAGNWSERVSSSAKIDVTQPRIADIKVTVGEKDVTAYNSVYYFKNSSIVISGSVSDNNGGSGIKKVQYSFDSAFNENVTDMDLSDGASKYSKSVDMSEVTGAENKNKLIYIRTIDHVGNISEVRSITLHYDTLEADADVVATITATEEGKNTTLQTNGFTDATSVTYQITPTAGDSLVREVQVYEDGKDTPIQTITQPKGKDNNGSDYYEYTVSTTGFVSGQKYKYKFVIVRLSGTEGSCEHAFTYDNTNPSLSISVKAVNEPLDTNDYPNKFTNELIANINSKNKGFRLGIKSFINWHPKFVLEYSDDTALNLYSYIYEGITSETLGSLAYADLENISDWTPVSSEETGTSEIDISWTKASTYLVIYKAVDQAGHTTYAASNGVVFDAEPPKIKIANTTDEWLNANNIKDKTGEKDNTAVKFTVTDNYSGIDTSSYEIYKSGDNNGENNLYDYIENNKIVNKDESDIKKITFDIKTDDIDEGNYFIYMAVRDKSGNRFKNAVNIKKDITAPAVAVSKTDYANSNNADSDNAVWINQNNKTLAGTDKIVVTIQDPDEVVNGVNKASGIKEYKIYTDKSGTKSELSEDCYSVSVENSVTTVTVTTAKLEDGDYSLYFEATDVAGNVTESKVHVLKDTKLPAGSIAATPKAKNTANEWKSYGENVTYNWFTNEKTTITLKGEDSKQNNYASDIESIEYCTSEEVVSKDKLNELTWTSVTWTSKEKTDGFTFDVPGSDATSCKAVVYYRVIDKAGNVSEPIRSQGIVYNNGTSGTTTIEYDYDSAKDKQFWIKNTEKAINISVKDTYSGLSDVKVYRLYSNTYSDNIDLETDSNAAKLVETQNFSQTMSSNENYKCDIESKDLPEGEYYLVAVATDKCGNVTKAPCKVLKDITAPTGRITLDEKNYWEKFADTITFGIFKNEKQTYTVTYKDKKGSAWENEQGQTVEVNTQSKIDKVYYYVTNTVEGKLTESEVKALSEEKWKPADNVNGKEEGSFTIEAEPGNSVVIYIKLIDIAGNENYISSDGVVIDDEPPVIEVNYKQEGVWTNNPDDISIKLTDNLSGFAEYKVVKEDLTGKEEYVFTDSTGKKIEFTDEDKKITSDSGQELNVTIRGNKLDEGDYNLVVYVKDRSGKENKKVVNIKNDRLPPKIEYTYPTREGTNGWINFSNKEDTIKILVTDENAQIETSGIKSINVYRIYSEDYDESSLREENILVEYSESYEGNYPKNREIEIKSKDLPEGTYYIAVEATDLSGKTKTQECKILKDTTLPCATIELYDENNTLDGQNRWENKFVKNIIFGGDKSRFKNVNHKYVISYSDDKGADWENKQGQTVEVNAQSKIDKVYYYVTEKVADKLTKSDCEKLDKWIQVKNVGENVISGSFEVPVAPNSAVVVYVKLVDIAGNEQYISSDGIILDSVSPNTDDNGNKVISMTSYMSTDASKTAADKVKDKSEWTSNPDDITVTLTDNLAGFASYRVVKEDLEGNREYVFKDDKGNYIEYSDEKYTIDSDDGEEIQFTIPGETLDEGDYNIVVRAVDRSGNEYEDTQRIKVDRTKPSFNQFSYGSDNVWTNDKSLTITSEESDATAESNGGITGSGIEHIEYYINGNATPYLTETIEEAATQYEHSHTIQWSDLRDGEYEVRAVVYDYAGNSAEARTIVKKDTKAPTVQLDYTRNNQWTNDKTKANIISKEEDLTGVNTDNNNAKGSGIEHIEYYINGNTTPYLTETIEEAATQYEHSHTIQWSDLRDGEYEVRAVVYDYAGNSAEARTIVKKDTKAPTVQLDYTRNNQWTNDKTKANIISKEEDLTGENTDNNNAKGSGIEHVDYYINGSRTPYYTYNANSAAKTYNHDYTIQWSVLIDGDYSVEAVVYDYAGNSAVATTNVKKDTVDPTGTITLDSNNFWQSFVQTITFGIFANTAQTFTVTTDDITSGVSETAFLRTNVIYTKASELPTSGWLRFGNAVKDSLTVSPNEDVIIYLRITDQAGNVTYISSNGLVVDDTKPVGDLEKPTATIYAEPVANDIYKNSVNVSFTVTDPNTGTVRSGLKQVRYYIRDNDTGNTSPEVTRNILSDITGGNTAGASKAQLEDSSTYSETLTVDIGSFNSNDVEVVLNAEDNSGNVMDEVTLPLKLDNTRPVVNVSYDNNTVGGYDKYFSADRTMTVAVTERNFNPAATIIYMTKDGVESTIVPDAGEWVHTDNRATQSNGDADVWTYRYTFNENVDYTVRIECTDLAGNTCETYNYEGAATQEFTVDKTLPVITANDRAGYSSETSIFTATITEHNFDSRDAVVLVTRRLNGQVAYANQPYNASWSSNGDIHTATLVFADDGDYTFAISYKDKAGNEAVTYNSQEFTVDNVDPVLTTNISAANRNIANKGNINFEFVYTDINSGDSDGMITYKVMTLAGQTITGWTPTITNITVDGVNGYSIRFDDYISNSVLKDGIYTIEITVRDKSGRSVTERQQFSVNRNGSAYSYKMGEYTSTVIMNQYVQNVTEDIELVVMNCDEVTDYQVIVFNSLNEQTILKADDVNETNDYSWTEEDGGYIYRETSDNREAGFTLYSCKIHKSVFEAEGTYTVVVATKDAADDALYGDNATLINNTEAADNTINVTANLEAAPADEVSFTVDRTAPEVVIIGLRNNQTYELDTDFDIDYSDANEIKSIVVERTSGNKSIEKIDIPKSEIDEIGINNNGKAGRFTKTAKEYNDYQNIIVTVVDAAGNEGVAEVRVLVTSNFWVRFINNKPLLIGTIAAIVAAAGLAFFLIMRRRKGTNAAK